MLKNESHFGDSCFPHLLISTGSSFLLITEYILLNGKFCSLIVYNNYILYKSTDAVFPSGMLMEKFREGQTELHCVFVDLEEV